MQQTLVTGAAGFVGRAVSGLLSLRGTRVTRAVRHCSGAPDEVAVGDIDGQTCWRTALEGCDSLVHLAARLPGSGIEQEAFDRVNAHATGNLLRQAAEAGIGTAVFLSSIAVVCGHASDDIISDASPARPGGPYGRSKLAAEQHVGDFAGAGRTGITLRAPLIYGAEAGGSWRMLQKLAASRLPLPFGSVGNRRTMISIDNLTDAICRTLDKAAPSLGGVYAVADDESLSLAAILTHLRQGMGLPPRLVTVPVAPLAWALRAAGRRDVADSLFGDLEVSATRFRTTFDWAPVETAIEGIGRSGAGFIAATGHGAR